MKNIVRIGLVLLATGAGLPAQAALSGYYDSVAAMAAVLETEGLADALRQQPVAGMDVAESDGGEVWKVRTRDCLAEVALRRIPPNGPGVNSFETSLGTARCD